MSLQTAIHAAKSNLRATQVQTAVTSQNIANATVGGYVRKDLAVATAVVGGTNQGVQVTGVDRSVDELLIRDARAAQSRYAAEEARASLLSDYTTTLGQPQDERSVAKAVAGLALAFETLYAMPDDQSAQAAVIDKADALAARLGTTADAAAAAQTDARELLRVSVDEVNTSLHRISDLNRQVAALTAIGGDPSDLMDQRDRLLDAVSEEIGIRTFTRETGEVVVMTRNGQTLLDGELADGADPLQLAGTDLQVNGETISDDPDREVQSGRIMGYLQVAGRDMPAVLDQLDALAAALVQPFQTAEADPTQPGLFTDAGAVFTTAAGLAGRIAVNGAVEGNSWRMQSGVQAAVARPAGDQTQIKTYLAIFSAAQTFTAPDVPASATLADYAAALVSVQQGYRTSAEAEMMTLKISADTLSSARINRDGVNVDDETARLLLVEQSYSASAQVIKVAGEMIETLLEIAR